MGVMILQKLLPICSQSEQRLYKHVHNWSEVACTNCYICQRWLDAPNLVDWQSICARGSLKLCGCWNAICINRCFYEYSVSGPQLPSILIEVSQSQHLFFLCKHPEQGDTDTVLSIFRARRRKETKREGDCQGLGDGLETPKRKVTSFSHDVHAAAKPIKTPGPKSLNLIFPLQGVFSFLNLAIDYDSSMVSVHHHSHRPLVAGLSRCVSHRQLRSYKLVNCLPSIYIIIYMTQLSSKERTCS